ncbi:MAG TPA: hypothetical protein VHR97_08650 [Candidatus Baltobacteraceae bacterium]|jgi:hypothetical protein|nr:hypothetical protein [Candidatus Baltobacteraceae bacterium]
MLVEVLVLVLVLVLTVALTVALGVLRAHGIWPMLSRQVSCVRRSIRHVRPLALT